jgi:hypothetical protein
MKEKYAPVNNLILSLQLNNICKFIFTYCLCDTNDCIHIALHQNAHKREVKLSHYKPSKRQGGEVIKSLFILDLSTRWESAVSVRPQSRFTAGNGPPHIHWIGGSVGLSAVLDTEATEKILCLCQRSNTGHPVYSETILWLNYLSSIKIYIVIATLNTTKTNFIFLWTAYMVGLTLFWIKCSAQFAKSNHNKRITSFHLFKVFTVFTKTFSTKNDHAICNMSEKLKKYDLPCWWVNSVA